MMFTKEQGSGLRFGRRSRQNIDSCHPDLKKTVTAGLFLSSVDFGVSQGARSYAKQLEYFKAGKSRIDPRIPAQLKHAKHLVSEQFPLSRALDIYIYVPGRRDLAYDPAHLAYVMGILMTANRCLYKTGQVQHLLRLGLNWDQDGEILTDQDFDDMPHCELVGVKPFNV